MEDFVRFVQAYKRDTYVVCCVGNYGLLATAKRVDPYAVYLFCLYAYDLTSKHWSCVTLVNEFISLANDYGIDLAGEQDSDIFLSLDDVTCLYNAFRFCTAQMQNYLIAALDKDRQEDEWVNQF